MTESLLDAFDAAVTAHGQRTAIVEKSGRHVSFETLAARYKALAGAWARQGLGRGDRVLLAMPVGADLYAALAAIWSLGATAVLPEPAMGLKGVRHAIRATACKGLVASGPYTWLRVLLPGLWGKPLFRPGPGSARPPGSIRPDDIALISFTSGSTGAPKAIPRSHAFLKAQQNAVGPLLESERDETDLVAFPVFVLINLAAGRTSVLPNWPMTRLDRVDPETLSHWIRTQEITRALLPPVLVSTLSRAQVPRTLHTVFTGGGPVFPDVIDRLTDHMPGLRVVAVYGSTEAEPIAEIEISGIAPEDAAAMKAGAGLLAGRPVKGLELRIQDGEILVAGAHVNSGYLDPARDAETKIPDGDRIWHRTGDAGRMDENGRLWLQGRHGAEVCGLHPFSVEAAARTWPGVKAAALIGLQGKPLLVIEGNPAELQNWQNRARAFLDLRVHPLRKIPMDRRHRSKVDYASLRSKLRT